MFLQQVEAAAAAVVARLQAAGEAVTLATVLRLLVAETGVAAFEQLGAGPPHNVPSLRRLIDQEQKLNAFIASYCQARAVCTAYELEQAVCREEGVASFDALRMGCFPQLPAVVEAFGFPPHVQRTHRISTADVLELLSEFRRDQPAAARRVSAEELLQHIATLRSVPVVELGVRARRLGLYVGIVGRVWRYDMDMRQSLERQLQERVKREAASFTHNARARLAGMVSETVANAVTERAQAIARQVPAAVTAADARILAGDAALWCSSVPVHDGRVSLQELAARFMRQAQPLLKPGMGTCVRPSLPAHRASPLSCTALQIPCARRRAGAPGRAGRVGGDGPSASGAPGGAQCGLSARERAAGGGGAGAAAAAGAGGAGGGQQQRGQRQRGQQ